MLADGAREQQVTASIAASIQAWMETRNEVAYVQDERYMNALERRRLELELGPGGDHDVSYRFVKACSLPQLLSWIRLLTTVQGGISAVEHASPALAHLQAQSHLSLDDRKPSNQLQQHDSM